MLALNSFSYEFLSCRVAELPYMCNFYVQTWPGAYFHVKEKFLLGFFVCFRFCLIYNLCLIYEYYGIVLICILSKVQFLISNNFFYQIFKLGIFNNMRVVNLEKNCKTSELWLSFVCDKHDNVRTQRAIDVILHTSLYYPYAWY